MKLSGGPNTRRLIERRDIGDCFRRELFADNALPIAVRPRVRVQRVRAVLIAFVARSVLRLVNLLWRASPSQSEVSGFLPARNTCGQALYQNPARSITESLNSFTYND